MRRYTTWPWSSTHRGRFWSWGEATTMPRAWKEPWWAPSAQLPPLPAPEWGQARETPQETTGRRAGHWAGGREGVVLWPSILALLTWRCRSLLQRGARPRALGCEPAPGAIWDSPFKPHGLFWETGSYCSRLTQEDIEPPKNSPCSRLHSRSDQPKIQTQLKKKTKHFAFFYYHKKSVWEDLGRPELQGKVSTKFPVLLLNLLRWGEILEEISIESRAFSISMTSCFAHCSNKDVAWEKADGVGARYQDYRATKRVERGVQRPEPRAWLTHSPLAVYRSDDQAR